MLLTEISDDSPIAIADSEPRPKVAKKANKSLKVQITAPDLPKVTKAKSNKPVKSAGKSIKHSETDTAVNGSAPDAPSQEMFPTVDYRTALSNSFRYAEKPVRDWSQPEANAIGRLCKLYWKGDKTWFFGRILNYDCARKQYFVFYLDQTVEWVTFQEETEVVDGESDTEEDSNEVPMMIASDIVWAKMAKQPLWPAQVSSVTSHLDSYCLWYR